MPIIGNVGRKSLRVRFLNVSIHLVLILGALTMLYPFMIMISGSFKSSVDSKVFSILPKYWYSDAMLFKKYAEARMNEMSAVLASQYKSRFLSFDHVEPPEDPVRQVHTDWQAFLQETKDSHTIFDFYVAEQSAYGVQPRNNRKFRSLIKSECDRDISRFNDKYSATIETWDEVAVYEPVLTRRNFQGNYEGILARYEKFKLSLPLWQRVYVSLDGEFIEQELKPLYAGKLEELNRALGTDYASWSHVHLPSRVPDGPLRKHWVAYVKNTLNLQFIRVDEEARPLYQKFLKDKYDKIGLLNRLYKTDYESFEGVVLLAEVPRSGARFADWSYFIETLVPPEHLSVTGLPYRYREWLKKRYKTIEALNEAHEKGYKSLDTVVLRRDAPETNLVEQRDWLAFVREEAEPTSITLKPTAQREWQDWAKKRFPGEDAELDVAQLNEAYGTDFDKAMNVYPARELPQNSRYRQDWLEFIRTTASPQFLQVDAEAESGKWKSYLKEKYGSVEKLNAGWGTVYDSFDDVNVNFLVADFFDFLEHKSDIFWEFFKRNYVTVASVFLYNGRAILNTVVYCGLAILTALLVNPLAAYAMSRYKLPTSYKIILVLMLTMAFPPMVMGIPTFLLIKKLGLLNTFAALVLPAAANGYFIFLLKGFFDSLPSELFESATIDGAKEWQIFWNVAMALSKPIMAVIALNAFNAAYRNFMMAFLLCQDRSMWTLMVHIYQLIQRSSQGVGFAALVVASIPTFGVFVFCQNIIIRGIVVPTEK